MAGYSGMDLVAKGKEGDCSFCVLCHKKQTVIFSGL